MRIELMSNHYERLVLPLNYVGTLTHVTVKCVIFGNTWQQTKKYMLLIYVEVWDRHEPNQ